MTLSDLPKWNKRAAAVYAFGIWTMIGSYAYFRYTGRYEDKPVTEEVVQEQEDPDQVVHQTLHSKTILTYKKDFVPYSTRIYNFIRSFSSEPGTGGDEK
ncbi:small integral membrane protein 26-like [Seriola dumerili]|uniref:small integral membrane protein 26-like n=1 Tax=Seriola dumerili TaxID=41447 RepID=UPI000BBE6A95|nr:small integral membrane protein 26-like [Seriola dumerili]